MDDQAPRVDIVRHITLPLKWTYYVDDAAMRQRGNKGWTLVTRTRAHLSLGPILIGGYEVDEGHASVKAFVLQGVTADRRKFATVTEAESFLLSQVPE